MSKHLYLNITINISKIRHVPSHLDHISDSVMSSEIACQGEEWEEEEEGKEEESVGTCFFCYRYTVQ